MVELINVPHIFHYQSVKACLSTDIKFGDFTVVYTLANPISSKVNKFISNLDVKATFRNNTILSCTYIGSGFLGKHHQHIVTGNLQIVVNNKLRKLFSKCSKYREKSLISWVKAKSSIIEGCNDCVDKWCSEHGMD